MDRLEKIRAKRVELNNLAASEAERKEKMVEDYTKRIKDLHPRISELFSLAVEMITNKIPLGKIKSSYGFNREEFVTEGINHRLGFYLEHKDGYGYLIGIGIRGGGCDGYDLVVNPCGEIVENPLKKRFRSYDSAYSDFCDKCKRFLKEFDSFEKDVFDYVDNL